MLQVEFQICKKNKIIWIQPVAHFDNGNYSAGPLLAYQNGKWCVMPDKVLISELEAVSKINEWESHIKAQIWEELKEKLKQ